MHGRGEACMEETMDMLVQEQSCMAGLVESCMAGGHAWQGGMCGRGACKGVSALGGVGGGMSGRKEYVVGQTGVYGRGCAWQVGEMWCPLQQMVRILTGMHSLLWKNIPFPYWCIYIVVKHVKPLIEKQHVKSLNSIWKNLSGKIGMTHRNHLDILCVRQTSLQFRHDSWSNVTDFAAISSGNGFQGATQTTNTETFCWWNMMEQVVLIQNETLTITKAF